MNRLENKILKFVESEICNELTSLFNLNHDLKWILCSIQVSRCPNSTGSTVCLKGGGGGLKLEVNHFDYLWKTMDGCFST